MKSKQLISVNFFVFAFYLIFFYLGDGLKFLLIPKIVLGFVFILICGIDLAVLLKAILKKDFDFVETMSFAFLGIFVLMPLFLFAESTILKKAHPFQPIITLSAIVLTTAAVLFLKRKDLQKPVLEFPPFSPKKILSSPLTWALLLETTVIIATVFLYKFLPDRDPFKWYIRLTQYFESATLSNFSYRPLFYSVSFLFERLTGLDTFVFLKYVIPALFLSVFFPIWLVARKAKDSRGRVLILLVPFLAPNAILYSLMGIPQTFLMILLFYFVFFLFYSYLTGNKFYYFAAGAIAFGSTLYHEAGILVAAIWMIATLAYDRKEIFSNKKDFFLILLILLSNLSSIKPSIYFVIQWTNEIVASFLHPQFNYTFPFAYTTIDGIETGGQSILGVAKTYLGYVGPAIILSFLAGIYLFLRKNSATKKGLAILKKSREFQVVFAGFAVFFVIAEILPRFPGIALLPDRAWIFASILFSFFMLVFVFNISENLISKKIYYTFVVCVFLSIGGAVYSNYLKKNVITDSQIQSARWMRSELPTGRIVLAKGNDQLIRYFSQSEIFSVDADFFYDAGSLDTAVDSLKQKIMVSGNENDPGYAGLKAYAAATMSDFNDYTRAYLNLRNAQEKNELLKKVAEENIHRSQTYFDSLGSPPPDEKISVPLYIYYAESAQEEKKDRTPVFDSFPDKFQKIYDDRANEIFIWRIL